MNKNVRRLPGIDQKKISDGISSRVVAENDLGSILQISWSFERLDFLKSYLIFISGIRKEWVLDEIISRSSYMAAVSTQTTTIGTSILKSLVQGINRSLSTMNLTNIKLSICLSVKQLDFAV